MLTWRASDPTTFSAEPHRRWAYNALDCCATNGAQTAMSAIVAADPALARVYLAERKLLAPALAVSLRGILIDDKARPAGARALLAEMATIEREIRRLAEAPTLNINSPVQLKRLFFGTFGLAEMRNHKRAISLDKEVMGRIATNKDLEWAAPRGERAPQDLVQAVAAAILEHRTLAKEREIFTSKLHHGRIRGTLAAGSTETFRFSSSKSPMGDGRNMQNVKKKYRTIFIPDPGFIMHQGDQKQAESLTIAMLCCDQAYINAHLMSDTHVAVARLCNPDLDWPAVGERCPVCAGALCAECGNYGTAEQWFARRPNWIGNHSIRDAYKRIQHTLNYLGTAWTVCTQLGIRLVQADEQRDRYFTAFPGILRWHEEIIRQIKEDGIIHYPGGYKRPVLGRRNDPATHREIVSSFGQSIIGWINHLAFASIWHELDGSFLAGEAGPPLQVLNHIHDAVLLQSRDPALTARAQAICTEIVWPMPAGPMCVPWDWKAGPNWKAVS